MLSTLRSFSKGKLATILVTIIIIPFVFWGMGSVFSGGKTNSVAKINSFNISTKDFVDHINNSKLSADKIKENINNNILEEFLTELVSNSVIDIEIEDLNIMISDKNLAERIKKNKSFHDEKNKFSRLKYEKFLLENNIPAAVFEIGLRKNLALLAKISTRSSLEDENLIKILESHNMSKDIIMTDTSNTNKPSKDNYTNNHDVFLNGRFIGNILVKQDILQV